MIIFLFNFKDKCRNIKTCKKKSNTLVRCCNIVTANRLIKQLKLSDNM